MNILIVVPGGVHPSGEIKVIPALLSLYKALSQFHVICIIAIRQDHQLMEYRLQESQVISLPMTRIRKIGTSYKLAITRLKQHGFIPDIIHSFWLGHATLLSAMLCRKFKVPLFTSIAGGEPANIPQINYGGHQNFISRSLNRLSLSMTTATSCGSHFLQTYVRDRWKVDPIVIPLGIDTSYWTLKECNNGPVACWNLLQLASINRVKNPMLMIEIVNQLKQAGFVFHLNWIGEDTLNGEIQRFAERMDLGDLISFDGFKTQTELKGILRKQHFVVQTSHYESQGIAMVEACSQGACPVGTNVGWLSDMHLGHSSSNEELANNIAGQIISLANNFSQRKDRVDKAQSWIRQNDVSMTAKRFIDCYDKLLN